jgi:hypothetical protein
MREISSARREEFYKTASIIRAHLDEQVVSAATQGRSRVTVVVPRRYVGRESYDHLSMGKALVDQFKADGFTVSGTFLQFELTWDAKMSSSRNNSNNGRSNSAFISIPHPAHFK